MSLRARLTLLYTSLLGGILLLFSAGVYVVVNVLLINQVDDLLVSTVGDILQVTRVDAVGEINLITLPPLEMTANVYVQVWDRDGHLQSTSVEVRQLDQPLDPQGLNAAQPVFRDASVQGVHLRVLTVPLRVGGRSAGIMQVATSLAVVDTARRDLLYILVAAALLAVLLTGLASWMAVGQGLSPLQAVTETALQISRADDLTRRIPYQGPETDEVGQLITAFNDTIARLEKLFASQQRFLADVSHELRTPLTVIKGNVDLMRRMGCSDQESLDGIEEEATRLTRLVGDLLMEAQAESGSLPMTFAPVELEGLLLDVCKEMRVLARERVQIKVSEIDEMLVQGDRDRLKQVLINLVSNAVKYTPDGGEVVVSLSRRKEQACLQVHDTGPGIPSEDLPHIFERFYRAEKSRTRARTGGFGLGLSIAQWIVNRHGGRIEVESRPRRGTTFSLWLPLSRAGELAPPTA